MAEPFIGLPLIEVLDNPDFDKFSGEVPQEWDFKPANPENHPKVILMADQPCPFQRYSGGSLEPICRPSAMERRVLDRAGKRRR